jgi:hypothetical protein
MRFKKCNFNEYKVEGKVATLTIINRKGERYDVVFDAEDIDLVSSFQWSAGVKKRNRLIYIDRGHAENGKRLTRSVYTDIMGGCPRGMTIDHADGDRLNNRKSNLRIATYQENTLNRPTKTGRRGVRLINGRWQVSVMFNYKHYYCGYKQTQKEAQDYFYEKFKEIAGFDHPWHVKYLQTGAA